MAHPRSFPRHSFISPNLSINVISYCQLSGLFAISRSFVDNDRKERITVFSTSSLHIDIHSKQSDQHLLQPRIVRTRCLLIMDQMHPLNSTERDEASKIDNDTSLFGFEQVFVFGDVGFIVTHFVQHPQKLCSIILPSISLFSLP
ncbi:hypothetical protein N7G274_009288 [Stereocaulon virgatum]|uniref:Uncharacterized protein n=1 Tax=Stereocaulon virgatum TaxID=373712 RepID=A0ABR3ZXH4_9LECA